MALKNAEQTETEERRMESVHGNSIIPTPEEILLHLGSTKSLSMRFAQFYFSVKDVEVCISVATEQSAI